jgi:hypothetical protein
MNLVDRRRLEKNSAKVTMGKPENASISLLANGYMSFQMPLNENFCWPQSDEEFKKRPRFSSYAVVEFPVSFFRMYRRLIDTFGISDNEWCVACCYHKAEGYFLAPGHPMSPFFDVGDAKMYSSSEDLVITDVIPGQFVSDAISYALLSKVYASFGLDERSIPFYLDQQSVFDIN